MNSRIKFLLLTLRLISTMLLVSISAEVIGDSATVLPQGVSRGYWDLYQYLSTAQRYNSDGEREDIAFPFSRASLDSRVLTSLAPLDAFVSGVASIGEVAVEYEYDIDVLDLGYSFGLTEKLSIGFHVPYYWITNDVEADFDSSSANVGLNPGDGSCCIPVADGGQPMSESDVQQLIADQYGFDEIETWDNEGIGDIELGAKYQVFTGHESAFAITGGLRIPTGYEDDADKLTDVAWSYGNYALLMRLHYDYLLSRLWRPDRQLSSQLLAPGDLLLNLTFRFDYMLPDKRTMRFGDTPDQIFTNDRERVSRKLGDLFNLELNAKYQVSNAFALSATYTYSFKSKDDLSGDLGYNYSSLEANTDSSHQIIIVSARYSTLAAYRKQQSAIPIEYSIGYRERFEGEGPSSGQANPVLYTRWLVIGMRLLF